MLGGLGRVGRVLGCAVIGLAIGAASATAAWATLSELDIEDAEAISVMGSRIHTDAEQILGNPELESSLVQAANDCLLGGQQIHDWAEQILAEG